MKMYGFEKLGINNVIVVYYNLSFVQFVEKVLVNNEGILSDIGVFVILIGKYIGCVLDDKFFVDILEVYKYIDWSRN